jgi:hypothetical protein
MMYYHLSLKTEEVLVGFSISFYAHGHNVFYFMLFSLYAIVTKDKGCNC